MYTYIFDGSFNGLLTVVFAIYEKKQPPDNIIERDRQQVSLFSDQRYIETNHAHAGRVRVKLKAMGIYNQVYGAFLTEQPDVSMLLYRFIHHIIKWGTNESKNYT